MALWSFVFTAEYAEWVWKRILPGKGRSVVVEMTVGGAKLQGVVIAAIVVEGKPRPKAAR
jgi:hypothetical protein